MFYTSTVATLSATTPAGQNGPPTRGPAPREIRAAHHPGDSPIGAAALACAFALVFIGVSVFTSYVEREQKSMPRERAQTLAMTMAILR